MKFQIVIFTLFGLFLLSVQGQCPTGMKLDENQECQVQCPEGMEPDENQECIGEWKQPQANQPDIKPSGGDIFTGNQTETPTETQNAVEELSETDDGCDEFGICNDEEIYDECSKENVCPDNTLCVNMYESHKCVEKNCKSGFDLKKEAEAETDSYTCIRNLSSCRTKRCRTSTTEINFYFKSLVSRPSTTGMNRSEILTFDHMKENVTESAFFTKLYKATGAPEGVQNAAFDSFLISAIDGKLYQTKNIEGPQTVYIVFTQSKYADSTKRKFLKKIAHSVEIQCIPQSEA